ncbi:BolA family protein [Rubellimicrobium roseum]|uniref:BolA family transcriptional regulator n=1 Tax=Rubellimicrobium roseum TaxID=687525 RepID=A0A5C4NGV4_9RHOB|nr:BolA family protein [Rubellimicrobium roseum]TNC73833.1 BolA family transcriptional regulator [Rubellimicrobium roseum]
MQLAEEMRQRLETAFGPTHLEVLDESEQHRGHGGWREGGGTHWRIRLQSPALAPMSRIERHRAVHAALGADIVGRIHALALEVGG